MGADASMYWIKGISKYDNDRHKILVEVLTEQDKYEVFDSTSKKAAWWMFRYWQDQVPNPQALYDGEYIVVSDYNTLSKFFSYVYDLCDDLLAFRTVFWVDARNDYTEEEWYWKAMNYQIPFSEPYYGMLQKLYSLSVLAKQDPDMLKDSALVLFYSA